MKQSWLVGCLALVLAWLAAPSVTAQTTAVNPVTVSFTPSVDHATVSVDGNPMVSKYEMRIFAEGGTTPLTTTDLGKPTPVSNLITITNAVWFSALAPQTKFVARVVAVGPTGEGVSDPSNPFAMVPAPTKPTAVVIKK